MLNLYPPQLFHAFFTKIKARRANILLINDDTISFYTVMNVSKVSAKITTDTDYSILMPIKPISDI